MGIEIWGRQLTTWGGVKLGSQKGVILAAQNELKLKVSPIVYLHAGLEIRCAIPHAIHPESNGRFPCTWPRKIFMPPGVVTFQIGSTIAKMAKSVVSGDRPG